LGGGDVEDLGLILAANGPKLRAAISGLRSQGIYISAVGRGFGDFWQVRGDEIEQHRAKS